MKKFPIKIFVGEGALQELRECEYGSYEDQLNDEQSVSNSPHIVKLIERGGNTVVTLNDQNELDEFFGSAMSGTWSLHCPKTAQRVWKQLAPYVDSEIVKMWGFERLGQ